MARTPLPAGITLTSTGKFHVDKTYQGQRYIHTCDTLAEAELFIAQVKTGDYQTRKALSVEQITLREACDRYIDERVRTSRSSRVTPTTYNSYAKVLYNYALPQKLLNNMRFDWKVMWPSIVDKYSASYANSVSTFAYGVQKHAYENGWTTEEPRKMGHVGVPEGRKRYLSDIEDAQCEEYLREHRSEYAVLYYFYMDTGCRKSEAFQLEWRDVDFKNNRITFWGEDTKTGRSRSISMTSRLATYLKQVRLVTPPTETKVFDFLSVRTFENIWTKMRNALGLSDDPQFVIHAMRHTCCTRLLANGVDLITAQHWMGHSDIRQTAAYAHVMPNNLDAAALALENHGQYASQYREVL